ncbi:hypothetical protein K9M74_03835 [Candidatus Woesearchaeota archaeon]|nr:hypothetical protein [Candidatus Woesearchaeota archaeon]MCF7859176.1 hypothetical protein [Candidatus Cloacimonadota bacterium]
MTRKYTMQDLLAKSKEKKKVEVNFEDGVVEFDISKIDFGVMNQIRKKTKNDDMELTREMIKASTDLPDDQVDRLPLGVIRELGDKISEHSGLDKASKSEAERFQDPQKAN